MTIELTEDDHHRLDEIIDTILTAFAENEVSLSHARSAFAQLFTAAAIDNEAEVRSWLSPERVAFWQKTYCRAKGSPKARSTVVRSETVSPSTAQHRIGYGTPPEKEVLEHLKTKFETKAEWRREKAEQYPGNKRNQKAAELFDRLVRTVDDIAPDVIHSYCDFFNGLDPRDPLPAIEIEEEHLRRVGFHTEPQNAEEFLRELIDELRDAGEASLRVVK